MQYKYANRCMYQTKDVKLQGVDLAGFRRKQYFE